MQGNLKDLQGHSSCNQSFLSLYSENLIHKKVREKYLKLELSIPALMNGDSINCASYTIEYGLYNFNNISKKENKIIRLSEN